MMAYLCDRMWLEPGKVSEDGLVYVDSTSDIGLGDQGPAALVNGMPLPALDRTRLDLVAGLIRNGKPLADWPRDAVRRRAQRPSRRPAARRAGRRESAVGRAVALGADGILAELDASGCAVAAVPGSGPR